MSAQNLIYLEKNWLMATSAKDALTHFRKLSPGERKWLLRHHDEEGINNDETWQRDDFDYLIGFYSIVEIAVTVGFVGELSPDFRKRHLPILSDAPVRRYYEVNYQLDLPRRLRERLQTGLGYRLPSSPKLNSFFYEFLELTKLIERDEDLESFLWTLDGGWRDGCSFEKVERALLKTFPLFEAIQTPNEKKSELEHALAGFCKFIQFCEGLASLLSRMEEAPEAAEAMWLAHAYWFRQLDYRIGDNLKLAFKSLARWEVGKKHKAALKRRVSGLTKLMQDISVPPMTKWKTGMPDKKSNAVKKSPAVPERVNMETVEVRSIEPISLREEEITPEKAVAELVAYHGVLSTISVEDFQPLFKIQKNKIKTINKIALEKLLALKASTKKAKLLQQSQEEAGA